MLLLRGVCVWVISEMSVTALIVSYASAAVTATRVAVALCTLPTLMSAGGDCSESWSAQDDCSRVEARRGYGVCMNKGVKGVQGVLSSVTLAVQSYK